MTLAPPPAEQRHGLTEEERMMFPAARGVLEREELLALGARMRALRSQLEGS